MALNRSDFEAEIESSKVFYFSCPEALNTNEPHNFICICKHPSEVINFSCCTSQFDTINRLIKKGRFLHQTFVFISKDDSDNDFTKDTYVNCNEYFQYSVDEFWDMYKKGEIKIRRKLPIYSFEQILIGFKASDNIEDELKDVLPDLDDL